MAFSVTFRTLDDERLFQKKLKGAEVGDYLKLDIGSKVTLNGRGYEIVGVEEHILTNHKLTGLAEHMTNMTFTVEESA